MSYQGLIIDFGGVVTTDLFAELSAFCTREGLDPGAFAGVLNDDGEGRHAFEDVGAGRISQREFEVTIGRLLGVDDRGLLARALGGLRPRPEVMDLIQRARQAGIRVGLLSNSWGDGQFDPYAGYDLDSIFDAVVISGDTGTRKPDAVIYLIATDELGIPPGECVFADDTAANLPVAEELGMATVHFTDAAKGIGEISRLLGLSLGSVGAVTDWQVVTTQDFAVPGGQAVPDLVEELCTMLASPDPAVRDDTAYPVLAVWTGRGVLDGHLGALGDRLADRMRQGQIYERTFAAMTLSWVILRDGRTGELDDQAVRRWLAAFALWWPQEKDVRGWDAELGWLHAVAHGADTLRAFARSPRLTPPDLCRLLELAVDRLLADDGYLFAHGEDDRVAYALATVLTRAELPAVHATRWLHRVQAAIEDGAPGPVPPWAANTLRTLAALYVFADRGVRWYEPHTGALGAAVPLPHAEQVKEAIAATLGLPWRGLG